MVAMPSLGRGMDQKLSNLKKKGSQMRRVGKREKMIIGKNFLIFLPIWRNDITFNPGIQDFGRSC